MNHIKELRESRNIQQKELAIDLGVTQPTISNWELGIKVPSARSTRKLAEYFGVSMDYVVGREKEDDTLPDVTETLKGFGMTELMAIGKRLTEIREARELPKDVFWENLRINAHDGVGYENGLRIPTAKAIRSVCRKYGVHEKWLLFGQGERDTVKKCVKPDPKDGDGFEERALRLIRAARRLSDDQRDFLLGILESAVERMPRETPRTERNLPESQPATVTTAPADKHNNS